MSSLWKRHNRRKANRVKRNEGERRLKLPTLNLRRCALPVLVGAGLPAGAGALALYLDQPIERVLITGRFQRVSPGDVERAEKEKPRGAGLLSEGLGAVGAAVRALPWVDVASVRRACPDALAVTVIEQVAAARWGESG